MWANGIQSSTFEYLKECYDNTTKVSDEALEKEYGSKAIIKTEDTADVVTTPAKKELTEPEPPVTTITATVPKTEVVEPPKLQIPSRPVMPPEAAAFPRLQKKSRLLLISKIILSLKQSVNGINWRLN